MAKYIVEIEEVVTHGVYVDAASEQEAIDKAYEVLAGADFIEYIIDTNYTSNDSAYEIVGENV